MAEINKNVLPTDLTPSEEMLIKRWRRGQYTEEEIARQIWANREADHTKLNEAIARYNQRMKAAGDPDMDMSGELPEWLKRTVRR